MYFRFLFWTELGKITKIGRANMDGTSKTYILRDIGWPNGLTIDYTGKRLEHIFLNSC